MAKPVIPRERAHRDVEEAIAYYLQEAGEGTALAFVAALEKAYRSIGERRDPGSPRYAHELDLPGLRHRNLGRFPWLVLYIALDDRIDIWRVLDARWDIPEWLAEAE